MVILPKYNWIIAKRILVEAGYVTLFNKIIKPYANHPKCLTELVMGLKKDEGVAFIAEGQPVESLGLCNLNDIQFFLVSDIDNLNKFRYETHKKFGAGVGERGYSLQETPENELIAPYFFNIHFRVPTVNNENELEFIDTIEKKIPIWPKCFEKEFAGKIKLRYFLFSRYGLSPDDILNILKKEGLFQ